MADLNKFLGGGGAVNKFENHVITQTSGSLTLSATENKTCFVILTSGGGGGAGGADVDTWGGGGGGAGNTASAFITVPAGETLYYVIGAGGGGGNFEGRGADGGDSYISLRSDHSQPLIYINGGNSGSTAIQGTAGANGTSGDIIGMSILGSIYGGRGGTGTTSTNSNLRPSGVYVHVPVGNATPKLFIQSPASSNGSPSSSYEAGGGGGSSWYGIGANGGNGNSSGLGGSAPPAPANHWGAGGGGGGAGTQNGNVFGSAGIKGNIEIFY